MDNPPPPPPQRPPPLPSSGKHSSRSQQQRRPQQGQDTRNKRRNRGPGQKGARQTQNFKRRSGHQPGQAGGQQLGFFGSVPSLQDLQRENRQGTARHYGNRHGKPSSGFYRRGSTPIQIPMPSKPTPARFLGADANPTETPTIGANLEGLGADKLEAEGLPADLDFYGTNEGLVFHRGPSQFQMTTSDDDGEMDSRSLSHSHSFSEEELDDNEDADYEEGGDAVGQPIHRLGSGGGAAAGPAVSIRNGGGVDLQGRILQRLRDRVAEQDAYIAQLEDDNLRLRERLEIQGQQLRGPRRGRRRSGVADADGGGGGGGETTLIPAENGEATFGDVVLETKTERVENNDAVVESAGQ